jgi:hypothetical protein
MSRPVIERRVDSILDSEFIKLGRNLRVATCLGTCSVPLPAMNQERER